MFYFFLPVSCELCKQALVTGAVMASHLELYSNCRVYYEKIVKTKSLMTISFQYFNCLFCNLKRNKKLSKHLEKSPECTHKFAEKFAIPFNPESVGLIMKKVRNEKRRIHPSRTKEQRKVYKEKIMFGMKAFCKKTLLSPAIVKCGQCSTVGTKKQVIKSDNGTILCKQCFVGTVEDSQVEPFIQNIGFSAKESIGFLIPETTFAEIEEDTEFCGALLPVTALPEELEFERPPLSQQLKVKNIYSGVLKFEDHYASIYENECKKIQDAINFSLVQPGFIKDLENKLIVLTETPASLSLVAGSDDYFERRKADLISVISEAGAVFFVTELEIVNVTLAAVASQLAANGDLKIEAKVEDSEECEVIYKVHTNHGPEENCHENCESLELSEFLSRIPNVYDNLSVATIAKYVQHVFRQYLSTIICDPNSPLFSSIYDGNLQFDVENKKRTKAVIVTWPNSLHDLNQKIANKVKISEEDIEGYVFFVDAVLTTSTDKETLQNWFELDDQTAIRLSELAVLHQLRQRIDECFQLPSQVTLVKSESKLGKSEQIELKKQYDKLLSMMEAKLLGLDNLELQMETQTWLYEIESERGFKVVQKENILTISFSDDLELRFPYEEEKIKNLMIKHGFTEFGAIYHRALTFSSKSSLEVVLRSSSLLDSHVKPFHPAYLLSSRTSVTSHIIGGDQISAVEKIVSKRTNLSVPDDNPLKKYEENHKIVHMIESLFRYDRNLKFTKSNIRPQFVNTNRRRKLKFVKAKGDDHSSHFQETNNLTWFEIYKSNLDYYYDIPGEVGPICSFDFLLWYNKCAETEDDSDEDDDEDLNDGDDKSDKPFMALCNDDWEGDEIPLPDIIKLTSGDVFVRRKSPKFITFPTTNNEEDSKFSEVIMFRPHTNRKEMENLSADEIEALYTEKDCFPDYDGLGQAKTKIQTIRTRILKTMFVGNLNSDSDTEFVQIYFDV